MTTSSSSGQVIASEPVKWAIRVAIAGALAIAVFALNAKGREMQATANRIQAAQIEEENRDVCQKLVMPFGTDQYRVCVTTLREVRAREAERIAVAAAGIL
jgi:hypothetical protein